MAPCHTAVRSAEPVKYKGIHEPKGRVKGFRVEIRPSGFATKIWVGTFETREKAMRAFDCAVYLTGKEPFYFVYPENYFPSRPSHPSKEEVQKEAKLYADRTDDLRVNAASHLVAHSTQPGFKTPDQTPDQSHNTTDVHKKAFDKMELLAGLDENLQKAEYLEVPSEISNYYDWTTCIDSPVAWYSPVADSTFEESSFSAAAFLRGYENTQDFPWNMMIDIPLLAPSDFPAIEDEALYLNFENPSKVSSKRKRDGTEGARVVTHDRKPVGFYEADAAPAIADAAPAIADATPAIADAAPAIADATPAIADATPAIADATPAIPGADNGYNFEYVFQPEDWWPLEYLD